MSVGALEGCGCIEGEGKRSSGEVHRELPDRSTARIPVLTRDHLVVLACAGAKTVNLLKFHHVCSVTINASRAYGFLETEVTFSSVNSSAVFPDKEGFSIHF